jgi:hypothetical protein
MCENNCSIAKKYIENKISKFESQLLAEVYGIVNSNSCIGRDGRNGSKGEKGDPGLSFITGNIPPNDTIGKNGDTYLDASTDNVYVKINGTWIFVTNIKGDKGDQGIQGTKGDKGDKGDVGTPGAINPDIISFGAVGVAPISILDSPLLSVVNYLLPFNRVVPAIPGIIGSLTTITADTNLITFTLPMTTARTARNPIATVTVVAPIIGDLILTLGTITNTGLLGTFTPSSVSITIPSGSLVIGTLTFSNATTDIFPAGSRLAVRASTTTGLINIGAGVSVAFNFELV